MLNMGPRTTGRPKTREQFIGIIIRTKMGGRDGRKKIYKIKISVICILRLTGL
jgi:hypothetical protein